MSEFLNSLNFGNSQNIIGLSALYSDPLNEAKTKTFENPAKRKYSDLPSLIDLDTLGENEKALFDLIKKLDKTYQLDFLPLRFKDWLDGLSFYLVFGIRSPL